MVSDVICDCCGRNLLEGERNGIVGVYSTVKNGISKKHLFTVCKGDCHNKLMKSVEMKNVKMSYLAPSLVLKNQILDITKTLLNEEIPDSEAIRKVRMLWLKLYPEFKCHLSQSEVTYIEQLISNDKF